MLYPVVYISLPYAALAMSMSSVIVSLWSMVPASCLSPWAKSYWVKS